MQEWPVTRVTYFQGLHLWNHERRHRNLKDKSGDMGSQSVLTLDIVTNYSIKTPWSLKCVVKSGRLGPTSPAWQNAFWSSGYYTVSILLLWYSSGFFLYCILFAVAFFLQNFQILMRFTVSLKFLFLLSLLPICFIYIYSINLHLFFTLMFNIC